MVRDKLSGRIQPTHGMSYSRMYRIWLGMKTRCYNEKDKSYKRYGGRGIKMCDEWKHDFKAFCGWSMENGYADNLSIDRKDVNGNYEPANCRWTTQKEQANNRQHHRLLTYNGKTQTIAHWADELGIGFHTIRNRIELRHWSIEKALSTRPKHKK